MGGIFSDRQIVVVGNKKYLDFHTPGWRSRTTDITSVSGKHKKWFLGESASSIQ